MKRPAMVSACELVEDFNLYPRLSVDSVHVQDLARALRAGVELPPVVADKASKRLSDGFHTRRAHIVVHGDGAQVPVIWKEYASDAELFADSVARNAVHGRRFDRQDQIRCTIRAQQLGLSEVQIAAALQVLPERVIELRSRVVVLESESIPIKPVAQHLKGETVVAAQAAALRSFGGNSLKQSISQLHKAIAAGLFNAGDNAVLVALHALASLILEKVPSPSE